MDHSTQNVSTGRVCSTPPSGRTTAPRFSPAAAPWTPWTCSSTSSGENPAKRRFSRLKVCSEEEEGAKILCIRTTKADHVVSSRVLFRIYKSFVDGLSCLTD